MAASPFPVVPIIPPPPLTQPSIWSSIWSSLARTFSLVLQSLFFREYPLLQRYSPRWLLPEFTWPHRVLAADQLRQQIPSVSQLSSSIRRSWIGRFHSFLSWFSEFYCAWYGFRYSPAIVPLPFGLILKWADGTSLDEAQSMMAVYEAGFPCPRVISVGEHHGTQFASAAPVSILMTRVPGEMLDEVYHDLEPADRKAIVAEISTMLETMRSWKNPWGQRICSISGGPIRSIRVPNHRVGPCESEAEFTSYLLAAASSHSFKTPDEFHSTLEIARKVDDVRHRIVFTHGDLALHNVLVHDGHVSGFIDWESAGWYPEYWEFTTPLRWPGRDPEGGGFMLKLGGERYGRELESEMAIKALTVDSWICM